MKPNIYAIDSALKAKGIPVDGVTILKSGDVVAEYLPNATDEQRMAGDHLIAEWDQEASDKARDLGKVALPTIEDINAATKLADVKAMALALRAFVDANG